MCRSYLSVQGRLIAAFVVGQLRCSFEGGRDVAKTYLKNEVIVADCIVGGENHVAELQQQSWSFGGEKAALLKALESS